MTTWRLIVGWLSIMTGSYLLAMDFTVPHIPLRHDVYASGYPTTPVRNTDPTFAGVNRDLTTVGWANASPTKSFVFLSPHHYLSARHFGGSTTITLFGADAQLHNRDQWKLENTNYGVVFEDQTVGDIQLGTLLSPFSSSALPQRPGILDLNESSDTNSPLNYNSKPILVYGRGPNGFTSTRVEEETLSSTSISGLNHFFTFSRNLILLEGGDSGSPTFADWTNPEGQPEPAVIGNHAAIDTENGWNFDNFVATHEVMLALNGFMNDDGRSLRVVGNPSLNWAGTTSTNISSSGGWGYLGPPPPEDIYTSFNGDQAGNGRLVTVNSAFTLRGLYFRSTTGSNLGFTFSGTEVLTIGRGGITNYDTSVQTFSAPLQLGASQYWQVGSGGVVINQLDTNGFLLELDGPGASHITGLISGSGSLAVDQGALTMDGTATYTGMTWVHAASLTVTTDLSSSPTLVVSSDGTLTGTGQVARIESSGTLAPGTGPAILTATELEDTGGLQLETQITAVEPVTLPPAPSLNDLIRLTGVSPLTQAFTETSRLRFYLDTGSTPVTGDHFLGGVFTDSGTDFSALLQNSSVEVYLADAGGPVSYDGQTYSLYAGTGEWYVDSVSHTTDFGSGDVSGRVLRLRLLPPAGTYANWTEKVFPDTVPTEDRDPDDINNPEGIANRFAYAHVLDPLNPDLSLLPYAEASPTTLTLYYREPSGSTDIETAFDATSDLTGSWTPQSLTPAIADPDPDGDGYTRLMQADLPLSGETLRFLRVRITLLP